MAKRSSQKIKESILLHLKEKPLTYAQLERKIKTGYRSIILNCNELQHYGLIEVRISKHPSNGRPSHLVLITDSGLRILKKPNLSTK